MVSEHMALDHTRARRLLRVVVVGVALMMLSSPAQAHARSKPKTVPFITHGHSTFSEPSGRECPPPPEGVIHAAIRSGTQLGTDPDDTFIGTDTQEGCFYLRQADNTAYAFGELLFEGTFKGCGTGTLRFRYEANFSAPDPETELRDGFDRAWVIRGSGTGDLASVRSGRLFGETKVSPDQTVTGTAYGYLRC